jgi:hypothetical protein
VATELELLQAESLRLIQEAEALDREFGSARGGRDFLTGAALEDWERRVLENDKARRNIGRQIRELTGQTSAAGNTAEQKVSNDQPTNIPGSGDTNAAANAQTAEEALNPSGAVDGSTKLAAADAARVAAANNGSLDQTLNTAADGTVLAAATNGNSESNFSGETSKTANLANKIPAVVSYSNALHNYTSNTYRITLFLLTIDDYTKLVDNPKTFKPKYALISSGGGFSQTAGTGPIRHPDFLEDFFIENLSLETIVGLNAKTKASNAVDISFNIVEPYGMSLLDRLMSACDVTASCKNYVEQPYLLQIDFIANVVENSPALGTNGILIDSKSIPIRFTEMKIKPSSGGTEYSIRAIPFNHTAFAESVSAVPVNMEVTATTIGDYFDSTEIINEFINQSEITEQRIEAAVNKEIARIKQTTGNTLEAEDIERLREKVKASQVYKVKSFPNAYNQFMKSLVGQGKAKFTQPPALIAFNIHDKIKNSLIVDENRTNADKAEFSDANSNYSLTIDGSSQFFKSKSVFNVHAGTNVLGLIERVMNSSEYLKSQVLTAKKQEEEAKQRANEQGSGSYNKTATQAQPLQWYKIIPQVYLKDFDAARNAYSKVVTYSILPYETSNLYHPDFKKTLISSKKCVRQYDYFYTGLNRDIINLDYDFNSAFIAQITAFQDYKTAGGSYDGADPEAPGGAYSPEMQTAVAPIADSVLSAITKGSVTRSTFNDANSNNQVVEKRQPPPDLPISTVAVINNTRYAGQNNRYQDPRDASVASLTNSIYTSSRGDMLNLRMKIVGDPAFIKQDEIFVNPMSPDYVNLIDKNKQVTAPPINAENGQIIFDQEEVYVQVNIKNAVDIDDTTGITNKQIVLQNGRTTNGSFSGIFRVMKVKSEFNRGQFTQVLDLIRLPADQVIIEESVSSTTNATVVGSKPTVQDLPGTNKPAEARPDTPQIDPKLIAAGNATVTNPVSDIQGEGTPTAADVAVAAAPALATDTANANLATTTELTFLEQTELVIGYKKEFRLFVSAATQTTLDYNARIQAARNNKDLSNKEKVQQEIAIKQERDVSYQTQISELRTLQEKVNAVSTKNDSAFSLYYQMSEIETLLLTRKADGLQSVEQLEQKLSQL